MPIPTDFCLFVQGVAQPPTRSLTKLGYVCRSDGTFTVIIPEKNQDPVLRSVKRRQMTSYCTWFFGCLSMCIIVKKCKIYFGHLLFYDIICFFAR